MSSQTSDANLDNRVSAAQYQVFSNARSLRLEALVHCFHELQILDLFHYTFQLRISSIIFASFLCKFQLSFLCFLNQTQSSRRYLLGHRGNKAWRAMPSSHLVNASIFFKLLPVAAAHSSRISDQCRQGTTRVGAILRKSGTHCSPFTLALTAGTAELLRGVLRCSFRVTRPIQNVALLKTL